MAHVKLYEDKNGDLMVKGDFKRKDLSIWERELINAQDKLSAGKSVHLQYEHEEKMFDPPERITILELYDRYQDEFNTHLGPRPEKYDVR